MACCAHKNERAIKFNRGIGFVQRGIVPDFYADKVHAVVMTMPARAYDRLFEKDKK